MTTYQSRLFMHGLFLATITILSGYFVWNLNRYMSFGIDLVGGTYVTLRVQLEKAYEYALLNQLNTVKEELQSLNTPLPDKQSVEGAQATWTFEAEDAARQAEQVLVMQHRGPLVERRGKEVVFSLPQSAIQQINRRTVKGNIEALEMRLNQFGVGEVLIVQQGDDKIVIELPNVHNPQQAKALIGKAALLEIKPVEDSAASKQALRDKYNGDLPEGTIIVPDREGEFYLVPQFADITGHDLRTSNVVWNEVGQPVVGISFTPEGAKKFEKLTSRSVGRSVAMIIDNEVISAPRVNYKITGEDATITGKFSGEEASRIALLLRSGTFLAPVTFAEERHIGPSLGQEAIQSGLLACGISLGLLLLFSVLIYRAAGFLAFIVLLYNLALTLFFLSAIGATLTLPGIAGMVLTVGMAIDASILIYERIREDLAQGSPLQRAIQEGFSSSMAVILDANVTHFLISIVLAYFGTGPIKGFAITMIVGILATLLTGLLLLRYLFTVLTQVLGVNKLSI